ncbi:MAG: tripartite tricarboxylate transporter substrate binding protein [Burkholderiales bacterium]|nr:tripartite tricarboxylate transporter substrate binding protein [Burkholderiales bacterium]
MRGRGLIFAICVLCGSCLPPATAPAAGPAFPARPLRFVVPFPPGTTVDAVARLLAQRLVDRLGQPVLVDNRSGGSGTIGVEAVSRATPDGHTWALGTTTTHALAAILNPGLGYDPVADFAPLNLLGEAPYFLTTHPGIPAAELGEFVAWARAAPGGVNYASVGNLSLAHLAGELLQRRAGFEMTHVPYKGSNLALVDLLAGRIQLNISTIPASLAQVKAGKLRALAVTSRTRIPALPRTATVAESGFPGYHVSLWVGVYAPARTPAPIVARLDREIAAVLGAADLREALADQGFQAGGSGRAALGALMREDAARWRKVIAEAGLKAP